MLSVIEAIGKFESKEDAGEGVEGGEQVVCLENADTKTVKEGERQV